VNFSILYRRRDDKSPYYIPPAEGNRDVYLTGERGRGGNIQFKNFSPYWRIFCIILHQSWLTPVSIDSK
jgi:hypothetical protein